MSNDVDRGMHQHRLRVRYAEVDAQAVVFNGHYLTYFDVGITEACRSVGLVWQEGNQPDDDFQLIRAEVDYIAPLKVDEEFAVGAAVAKVGNSSVHWQLQITGADGSVRARGLVIWVAVDLQAGKARSVSDATRQALAQLQV